MAGHRLLSQPLRQVVRDALREPARVDEDQGRAMPADQLRQPPVQVRPLLRRHHRFEVGRRHLDGQVDVALVAEVDDGAVMLATGASQEVSDLLDRLHRRRQADARRPRPVDDVVEPREAERQVRPAAIARQRVDLVDDHGAHVT